MNGTGINVTASEAAPKWSARAAVLVNLALIIGLAYTLAGLGWQMVPAPYQFEPGSQTGFGPMATSAPGNRADVNQIIQRHLFGKYEPPAVPVLKTVAVPKTKLNLKLAGIFHNADEKGSLALVAAAGENADSYAVGETLPGGALLERIEQDHILINRSGRLEKLLLPEITTARGIAAEPVPKAGTLTSSRSTTSKGATIDVSAVATKIREAAAINPDSLQDLAFVDPYVKNSEFIGFRLRRGRDKRLLSQIGLRDGDVITEINGTRLTDPITGATQLQGLLSAAEVRAQILRNGKEIPFTFRMSNL